MKKLVYQHGACMKIINAKNAPKAIGSYSQAVLSNNFMFISGQIPINPNTGQLIDDSFDNQVRQILDNINAILFTEKISFSSVVKITVFVIDLSNVQIINNIFKDYFIDSHLPARSMVQVSKLPMDAELEIDIIASINDK
tara:strand:+ start:24 stop:443 length:420 start_codon:yes stop_codon:yes gene_type:complete